MRYTGLEAYSVALCDLGLGLQSMAYVGMGLKQHTDLTSKDFRKPRYTAII